MRKLSACLVAATLGLAATSVVAEPQKHDPWQEHVEHFEWSSSKARLGVMVMSMTPELRQYFGAPSERGVLVVKVESGTPAAKAGIKVGDVLTNVRGEAIDDATDVISALADTKTGDKVTIQLVRDKKPMSLDATLKDTGPTASSFDWFRQAFPWFDLDKLPQHSSST